MENCRYFVLTIWFGFLALICSSLYLHIKETNLAYAENENKSGIMYIYPGKSVNLFCQKTNREHFFNISYNIISLESFNFFSKFSYYKSSKYSEYESFKNNCHPYLLFTKNQYLWKYKIKKLYGIWNVYNKEFCTNTLDKLCEVSLKRLSNKFGNFSIIEEYDGYSHICYEMYYNHNCDDERPIKISYNYEIIHKIKPIYRFLLNIQRFQSEELYYGHSKYINLFK
jgi:hypothetical protein